MRMFAERRDGELEHFYPSRGQVEMCGGSGGQDIVEVELTEDPEGPLWAWEDAEKPGRFSLVWPSRVQLAICFPYGLDVAAELGRGRVVRLTATLI